MALENLASRANFYWSITLVVTLLLGVLLYGISRAVKDEKTAGNLSTAGIVFLLPTLLTGLTLSLMYIIKNA